MRDPSSLTITLGSRPSMIATTLLVVPRSMPMILPMTRASESLSSELAFAKPRSRVSPDRTRRAIVCRDSSAAGANARQLQTPRISGGAWAKLTTGARGVNGIGRSRGPAGAARPPAGRLRYGARVQPSVVRSLALLTARAGEAARVSCPARRLCRPARAAVLHGRRRARRLPQPGPEGPGGRDRARRSRRPRTRRPSEREADRGSERHAGTGLVRHDVALDEDRIDPDAAKVVRRLERAGFQAYLVGGCVRDLLLGGKPKDFDVATSARPEDVRALFRNCRIIGRRFRLAHILFGAARSSRSRRSAAIPRWSRPKKRRGEAARRHLHPQRQRLRRRPRGRAAP